MTGVNQSQSDVFRTKKDNIVADYRRRHRTDAKSVKKFDNYLTCLCDFDNYFKYPSLAKWLGELPWQNYYFFHAVDSPPSIEDVKTNLLEKDERRAFTVITADELFTNFNKGSQDRPVGAFTHCLYELMLQKSKNFQYPNFTMDHVIVTGIDDYVSDDGHMEVCKFLHINNLKEYYDEAMPNLKVNAAKIKFIFTCTELPEMLLWRLAEDLFEKIIIEPDTLSLDQREIYRYALAIAAAEDWVKVSVNCTFEVESKIQSVLNAEDSQIKDVLTTKLTHKLQKELRRWYPNWRVCGVETEPTWRFSVPCVVYEKLERWYLVFYAPLAWSGQNQLLEDVEYDCGSDTDEVRKGFKEVKAVESYNNLNSIEHDLNSILDYPISLFPHQTPAGIHSRAILAKHREACRSINVALKYVCKKLMQSTNVDDALKSSLLGIQQSMNDQNEDGDASKHDLLEDTLSQISTTFNQICISKDQDKQPENNCTVVYCNRNTVVHVGNRRITLIATGPAKMIIFTISQLCYNFYMHV